MGWVDHENRKAIDIMSMLREEAVESDELRVQGEIEVAIPAMSYLAHYNLYRCQGLLVY